MKSVVVDITNSIDFLKEQKVYNSIVRFAYKRFKEGLKEKEVRARCKEVFPENNSWFVQCAIKDGQAIYNRFKQTKIIFGGKRNLLEYLKGHKSKEEYQLDKLAPICIQGEKSQKGNRLFDFHLNENYLVFKQSRTQHTRIEFKKLRKNLQTELAKVQELVEQNKTAVTVKLDTTKQRVTFVYDESDIKKEKYKNLKTNRVIGIDLNPNYIGLAVVEFNKNDTEQFEVLHKEVFDLTKLTSKNTSTNKRHHELIHICYEINSLVNTWKCSRVCIEELNIKSSDKKLGRTFNRLCNNVWNRGLVVNKLRMLANMHGYNVTEVNPAYSSFIGNIVNGSATTPDMVAAAVEIARRAYNKFNKGHFYPKFDIEAIDEQWKQTLCGVKDWKEAYYKAKELGLKYRFQLADCVCNAVFSRFYRKKLVTLYSF